MRRFSSSIRFLHRNKSNLCAKSQLLCENSEKYRLDPSYNDNFDWLNIWNTVRGWSFRCRYCFCSLSSRRRRYYL